MNATEQTIIDKLTQAKSDSHTLSYYTGVAKPSVRRSIAGLRRKGFNIAYGTTRWDSTYTLHPSDVATA